MEYYGNNDWRDYLALEHHGIEGQKWGHRNGPPYPLGYGNHSSAEKKANPKGKLDNYEPTGRVKKRRVTKPETPSANALKAKTSSGVSESKKDTPKKSQASGKRDQIKEEIREKVKSQAGAEYFKADENKIKSYVDELNKSLKNTAKARSAAAARTKYQTISNPNSKTGTSDFKVSNRDLDAKAEAAMKDWGKKYLTAAVYAEANGYKLEFDKKKNKHYLVKA